MNEPVVPEPVVPVVPADPDALPAPAEKHYTQAELNAAAAAARRADAAELKAGKEAQAKLAEIEAANLTAQEKADKRAADAEARAEAAEAKAAKAELDALKASIGAELGIPAGMRSRLIGSTEEEVRADAVAVAAELKVEPPKASVGGGGRPATDQTDTRVAELRAAAGLK